MLTTNRENRMEKINKGKEDSAITPGDLVLAKGSDIANEESLG